VDAAARGAAAREVIVIRPGSGFRLGLCSAICKERLARKGYYTDLYNKQLLEEELAEV
jgi:hypothetical protein